MILGGHGAHDLGERPTARVILDRIRDESEKGSWFERLFMRIALQQPEFEIEGIWPDLVFADSESRYPPGRAVLLYNRKADRMNNVKVKNPKSFAECKATAKEANQAMIDFDEAAELGMNMNEAIVFACQKRYIFSHAKIGSVRHYKDGQWWNYCSTRKLVKQIKILSRGDVRGAFKRLVSKGFLKCRNDMNEASYDRTLWYALPGYLTDEVPGKGIESGTNGKARHNGGVPRVNGKAKANGKASGRGGSSVTQGVGRQEPRGGSSVTQGGGSSVTQQYHIVKDSCSSTEEKRKEKKKKDLKFSVSNNQDSIESKQTLSGTGSLDSAVQDVDGPEPALGLNGSVSSLQVPASALPNGSAEPDYDKLGEEFLKECAPKLSVLVRENPHSYEKAWHTFLAEKKRESAVERQSSHGQVVQSQAEKLEAEREADRAQMIKRIQESQRAWKERELPPVPFESDLPEGPGAQAERAVEWEAFMTVLHQKIQDDEKFRTRAFGNWLADKGLGADRKVDLNHRRYVAKMFKEYA